MPPSNVTTVAAAARSAAPLSPGEQIAPGYEAISLLRRGNDLDVYDAWSEERGARCVVKVLRPDRLHKRRARAALMREGDLLLRLSHPHIVGAYEILDDAPAVVLETLPGATLGYLIDAEGQAEPENAAQLGLQLGSAVAYLHRNGFLHLDLKPSNVIVEVGRAKLIDLSIARPPGDVDPGVGTWHYLSPEQARGGPIDAATDVWGLGVVLFETVTGEGPFDDDADAFATRPSASTGTYSDAEPDRYPQLESRSRRVGELAETDARLAVAIDACLEPIPSDRPSLTELLATLESIARLDAAERRWSQLARRR
jgi:eukaryotic-like serine/threonine-protein kinase